MDDIFNEEIEEGLIALAINKAAGLEFISVELLEWRGDTMAGGNCKPK